MARPAPGDEIATVRRLCRDLGLGDVAPTVVQAAHHTTLRLPPSALSPLALVARVQSAEPLAVARPRAVRELAVTRHLAARGAPVLTPLDGRLAGPHVIAGAVVTLWPCLEPARTAGDRDAARAAAALAAVHAGLRDYAGDLPPYTATLDRCREVLALGGAAATLAGDDRALLMAHLARLRREVAATAAPAGPLHGDAHPGNLLIGPRGPVWIDFEDACVGPREMDIAGLPAAAWPSFGDADPALIRRCADLKSVCVAIWCAADPSRSAAVRAAAAYHLGRVRRWPS